MADKPKPRLRTPAEALTEFRYACQIWMACMDDATRMEAVKFAQASAVDVEFKPNCAPAVKA